MSRWIDADAIKNKAWKAESEACFYALEDVVSVTDIDEAPSIDVIRCGECKWSKANGTYQWCGRLDSTARIKADDFCSYGSSSEKPNNSTSSKMEQVETMSCAECKHRPIGAEICEEPCHYEPQTDWHYDEQDATWYPYKHEDDPQQKSCATCKHALGNWDGESNNCGRCCGADRRFYEPKDEPQTCSFSDCDNFKNPDYERCIECKRKQIKLKTEQTEVYDYKGNGKWERSK